MQTTQSFHSRRNYAIMRIVIAQTWHIYHQKESAGEIRILPNLLGLSPVMAEKFQYISVHAKEFGMTNR
jgi:hypothetical protein